MNFHYFLQLISVDPTLGKLDKHLLSQQTLMELFIAGVVNKEKICGDVNESKDISEWEGVSFNDAQEVIGIRWFGGSVDLKWLPQTTQKVFLIGNNLSGTADLTCLPDGLVSLSLSQNQFDGTIDLTKLPSGMKRLLLEMNDFHGETDFSQLPKSLVELYLSDTNLEGEIFSFDGDLDIENSKIKDMRAN